jgi:aminomethyltransferase
MMKKILPFLKINKKTFTESAEVQIRRTALYSFHKDVLKAKMVPFAGYDMPVQYTGIIDEHMHCREAASIFDVGHMGQLRYLLS